MILNFTSFVFETYWDLENKTYTLYHATLKKNLDSILKNGIKQSIKSDKKYSGDFVWCADTKQAAYNHAYSRMIKRGDDDEIIILELKLKPSEIKLHKAFSLGIYTIEDLVEPKYIHKIIKYNNGKFI